MDDGTGPRTVRVRTGCGFIRRREGGGVPDKMPVEQSERVAAEACYAFREAFPDAKTETTYRRDAVEGILEVANEIDANAIVLGPRGGARTLQWLAGDRSLRLLTEANRPVIPVREGESA